MGDVQSEEILQRVLDVHLVFSLLAFLEIAIKDLKPVLGVDLDAVTSFVLLVENLVEGLPVVLEQPSELHFSPFLPFTCWDFAAAFLFHLCGSAAQAWSASRRTTAWPMRIFPKVVHTVTENRSRSATQTASRPPHPLIIITPKDIYRKRTHPRERETRDRQREREGEGERGPKIPISVHLLGKSYKLTTAYLNN